MASTVTGAAHGARRLAPSLPALLVKARRCPGATLGQDGEGALCERKEKDMISREQYAPGAASGAEVRKDGEKWTLILVRELRHSPEKVWQALIDPVQLREWAPFDADRSLGTVGTTVKLTTVGAPALHVTETTVTRADAPKALQ